MGPRVGCPSAATRGPPRSRSEVRRTARRGDRWSMVARWRAWFGGSEAVVDEGRHALWPEGRDGQQQQSQYAPLQHRTAAGEDRLDPVEPVVGDVLAPDPGG